VPSLIENLLSIGKFSGESYFLIFERRNCQIVSKRIPRKIVSAATHEKGSSFYKLNMQRENNSIKSTCILVVEKQDDSCL
jgi:hypothetical protein